MGNMNNSARLALGNRKGETGVDEALSHILFCVKHQSPGCFLVQTLKITKNGGHTPDRSFWFDNQDPDLKVKIRATLSKLVGLKRLVLYTPCSYSKQQAKVEFALPFALAFVDADEGVDIGKVPHPSRIVASSAMGRHWFWRLTRKLPPGELQEINKWLTEQAGGDHGHSPAKKFRLPGFPNFKYDPPQTVHVKENNGEVHDAGELLKRARRETRPPNRQTRLGVSSIVRKALPRRDFSKLASDPGAIAARIRLWDKLDLTTRSRLRQKKVHGPFTLVIGENRYTSPRDDRSAII